MTRGETHVCSYPTTDAGVGTQHGEHGHVKLPQSHFLSDMIPRARFGFFSALELVLFLLVLFGSPGITHQGRSKGRWNKGGKLWGDFALTGLGMEL